VNVLDWESVSLIVPLDIEGQRLARVYCKHPTLTYDEWWLSNITMSQYVGVNEPPTGFPHISCSGEEAKEITDCFLETGVLPN